MHTKTILKPIQEETYKSNGMIPKPKLTIRAIRKGKAHGLIFETPYNDKEKAIEFAKGRFKKDWKLDKGYLKRQINSNEK